MHHSLGMQSLGSFGLVCSFVALTALLMTALGVAFQHLHRRGALTRAQRNWALLLAPAWLVVWGAIGHWRVLDVWHGFPPRALFAILALFSVNVLVFRSRVGRALSEHLSHATLIGVQVFRLPLELLMYRAMLEGLMPAQMSFVGFNYDILTGLSAIAIWFWHWLRPIPRWLVWGFNILGSVLLGTILVIAMSSLPTFQAFGPSAVNTWVFGFPYIYLPAVMVQLALLGHLLSFRKLLADAEQRSSRRQRAAHPM
jgi:hypothetical protein